MPDPSWVTVGRGKVRHRVAYTLTLPAQTTRLLACGRYEYLSGTYAATRVVSGEPARIAMGGPPPKRESVSVLSLPECKRCAGRTA